MNRQIITITGFLSEFTSFATLILITQKNYVTALAGFTLSVVLFIYS